MNPARIARFLRGEVSVYLRELFLTAILPSAAIPRVIRPVLLRLIGHSGVHLRCLINPGVFFGARTGLTLGKGVFINHRCFLDLGAPITIGDHVALSYETMLITCTHQMGPATRRFAENESFPITIGDGTWVGSRVTVLPGVTIGRGCVIAAGALVVSDCVDNGVYAGVPAKLLRLLDDDEPRAELMIDG